MDIPDYEYIFEAKVRRYARRADGGTTMSETIAEFSINSLGDAEVMSLFTVSAAYFCNMQGITSFAKENVE